MPEKKANTVVLSISDQNHYDFIAPNLGSDTLSFQLERHNPEHGIDSLLETINRVNARVLITGWSSLALPPDLAERAPGLEYVCHLCGEIGHLVPISLIEKGLIVTNWGDSIASIVAEHCLLQVLAALRNMAHHQISMHIRKKWKEERYIPDTLFGKRIGIHGFGRIAQSFVDLVRPFGCSSSAYSPNVPAKVFYAHDVRRIHSLEELYENNNVIVCLASLTPRTFGCVGEKLLRLIPEGGVFVNAGRGEVVDEEALVKVARRGRIGFALDVFALEPLPENSPLRGCENIVLTPHIGGPTPGTRYIAGLHALRNVDKYFRGEKLNGIIDVERYSKMSNMGRHGKKAELSYKR